MESRTPAFGRIEAGHVAEAGLDRLALTAEDVAEDAAAVAGGAAAKVPRDIVEDAAVVVAVERGGERARPVRVLGVVRQRADQHGERGGDGAFGGAVVGASCWLICCTASVPSRC
jgi:hypothetical protein